LIGEKIKTLLEKKSMSVYALAKKGHLSNSYLSEIINNKKNNPSIETLQKISMALEIPIEELIKDECGI
jgi:XRE family transcriptional regulator, master regulator for biofilm formation